jgi:predicted enzyme related to lactoylglutathione lyase
LDYELALSPAFAAGVETEERREYLERETRRGGTVLDRRTIPFAGELALFTDPEGNVLQLRQPPTTSQ